MDLYMDFKYPLDDFQKEGIRCINNNENILVTAHTGAGKTTLALHAISRCYHYNQSVIYTSPIKTLSNQKFNEFNKIFNDVGILTGDVKINPTASLLIMTAEILNNNMHSNNMHSNNMHSNNMHSNNIQSNNNLQSNNMQSNIYDFNFDVNKVKCVILDEVHYINDKDRGKVWEEIILKLPSNIQLVMLSATLDGAEKMAKWITELKNVKCNWITTSFRPVPLRHYFYIHDDKQKLLLLEGDTNWKTDTFNYVYSNIINNIKYKPKSEIFIINKLVEYLKNNNGLPATLFILNRNMVEKTGLNITLQLNDNFEVAEIIKIWDSKFKGRNNYESIYGISTQWSLVKSLLMKGIGIHHSGLIPLLKDIVEILYEKKLIKLLIATETFAMGVNMPTKTTIFTDLVKYDGNRKRYLYSNEYIQMAGRAGRRGMDSYGEVIILPNFKITENQMKNIMLPNPIKLVSKFDFNYSFILKNQENDIINKDKILGLINNTLMNINVINGNKLLMEDYENVKSKYDEIKLDDFNTYNLYKDMMNLKNKLNGEIKPAPKLKKELLKQISKLNENFKNNSNIYKEKYELEVLLLKMTDTMDELNNIYNKQFDILIEFMVELNIINNINNIYYLLEDGKIMSMVNDCNPLIILNVVKMMDDLSFEEIVGIISLLVDDTNTEWYRLDDNLKTVIEKEMSKEYLDLVYKLEKKVFEIFKLEDSLNNKLLCKMNCENVYGYNNFYQSYLWAKGCKYSEIKSYNLYDGNFIKNILRVVNILRNLVNIYTYLFNTKILNKLYNFEEKLIRDIVTVDSLYISGLSY